MEDSSLKKKRHTISGSSWCRSTGLWAARPPARPPACPPCVRLFPVSSRWHRSVRTHVFLFFFRPRDRGEMASQREASKRAAHANWQERVERDRRADTAPFTPTVTFIQSPTPSRGGRDRQRQCRLAPIIRIQPLTDPPCITAGLADWHYVGYWQSRMVHVVR